MEFNDEISTHESINSIPPDTDSNDKPDDEDPQETQITSPEMALLMSDQANPFGVPMSQLKDILEVPKHFEEAFYHSHPWCKARWRDAIKLELAKMEQLKVWTVVDKRTVTANRRLVKNRWVLT
jgi:hypothetical protein